MPFPNPDTQFKPGESGNPAGRPPGPDLSTRIRRLLEGDDELPEAIRETILRAVGTKKKPLDAVIIVGLLQALQGEEKWGKLLFEHGYGKALTKAEITGKDGGDIKTEMTIRWADE